MIAEKINWQQILQGKAQPVSAEETPKMLRSAMLTYGLKVRFGQRAKQFKQDYQCAQDVLQHARDRFMHIKLCLALLEIGLRCVRYQKRFQRAATDDIEWNGDMP